MSSCEFCAKQFTSGDNIYDVPIYSGNKLACPACYASYGFQGGMQRIYHGAPNGSASAPAGITPVLGSPINIGMVQGMPGFIRSTAPFPIPRNLTISGRNGVTLFELKQDGTIYADWKALMDLKDRWVAGDMGNDNPQTLAFAAALWFARNT